MTTAHYPESYLCMAKGIERLRQKLETAYDGLVNHHAHSPEQQDEITNEIGAAIGEDARKRIAGA